MHGHPLKRVREEGRGEGGEERGRRGRGRIIKKKVIYATKKKTNKPTCKPINETLYKKQVVLLKSQLKLSADCLQKSRYKKRGDRIEKLFAV